MLNQHLLIHRRDLTRCAVTALALFAAPMPIHAQNDPLPSWNTGAAKQAILDFVAETTTEGDTNFVAPEDRIATFDQDGTTRVEHPLYGQGLFALDRLAEIAPEHPDWKDTEPFKAALSGDHAAMAKFTEKDWMEIVAVTHADMSTADFEAIVANWLPRSKKSSAGLPTVVSSIVILFTDRSAKMTRYALLAQFIMRWHPDKKNFAVKPPSATVTALDEATADVADAVVTSIHGPSVLQVMCGSASRHGSATALGNARQVA